MKIIADKNCTGKTKALIETSLKTGTPILAPDAFKAASLKEKARAYFKQDDLKIISLDEAKNYDGKILIDDADEFLPYLLQNYLNNPDLNVSGIVVNL